MAYFSVRYDLRCPPEADASRGELYRAALEQAAYADASGLDAVVLSEHHGVADGYLPSPLTMAAAVAARTDRIAITVAALLVPLHDPIRLAEDTAVLDHLGGGRMSYVAGLGYRREEYDQLGVDWSRRGAIMESHLRTLLRAWTGEPFDHDGRRVRVTPSPATDPHPMLLYGGGSPAAARRAARFGLGFFPQHADQDLARLYHEECDRHGHDGFVISPPSETGTFVCAEDPDRFWAEHGDRLLYEARSYASWQGDAGSAVLDTSATVDDMRESAVYRVCTPDELAAHVRDTGEPVTLHPLIGGLDPAVGWRSLELVAEEVIPAVRR